MNTHVPDFRSSSRILGMALAAGLTLQACGGGEAGPGGAWAGRIDTLPDGAVQVLSPATGIWSDEETWTLVEDLRIGSMESDGPELMGQVGFVTIDDGGALYVLENQTHELRVFDADGIHVRTMGGEGQGPGELNVPFGGEIFLTDAAILVNNTMNRRWEAFAYDGTPEGSTPSPGAFFGMGTVQGDDGSLYTRGGVFAPGEEARFIVVELVPEDGRLVTGDTIDGPQVAEPETVEISFNADGNQMVVAVPVPYVHQPQWKFDRRGFFWIDDGDGYRLRQQTPDGRVLRIIGREFDPIPVTEDDIERALAQYSSGPFEDAPIDIDRGRIPDTHPPLLDHRTDDVGNLWVRRSIGGGAQGYDVFDPEGRYLGPIHSEVALARLTIHRITDEHVYGVLLDEFDIPYVVRLGIVKGGSAAGS